MVFCAAPKTGAYPEGNKVPLKGWDGHAQTCRRLQITLDVVQRRNSRGGGEQHCRLRVVSQQWRGGSGGCWNRQGPTQELQEPESPGALSNCRDAAAWRPVGQIEHPHPPKPCRMHSHTQPGEVLVWEAESFS